MGNIDWDKLNKTFSVTMNFENVLKQEMNNNPSRRGYDDTYSYKGIGYVPRVSNIIKICTDQTNLIDWAARIGKNKMEMYRDNALDVGSTVHKAIEEYLNGHEDYTYIEALANEVFNDPKLVEQCITAFNNFIHWEKELASLGYQIYSIANEKEVICPLYGGTIDWIAEIIDPDGISKKYIIDFKTSKGISSSYLLQTAAYRLAWNWLDYYYNGGNNYINGIGIIRLDKYSKLISDYLFTDNYELLDRLEYDVRSMINWFYCNSDAINILRTMQARRDFYE